jgi:hypothetical protein
LCKWGSHAKAEGEVESNSRKTYKIDAEIQWRKGPRGGVKTRLILFGFYQSVLISALDKVSVVIIMQAKLKSALELQDLLDATRILVPRAR